MSGLTVEQIADIMNRFTNAKPPSQHHYTLLTKDGKIRNAVYNGNDFCDHLHKILECSTFDSQTIGAIDTDHIAVYFDDSGMYDQRLNNKGANLMKALYNDSGLPNPFAHGVYGAMVFVHTYINEEGEGDSENNKALEYKNINELVKAIRAYHRSPAEYIESRKQHNKFMAEFMKDAHVIGLPKSIQKVVDEGRTMVANSVGGMPTL
jgi:hypothetical protein